MHRQDDLPRPPPPTDAPPPLVIPGELVGEWVSTDVGMAQITYRFYDDGSYESASVLVQPRPGGTFRFRVGAFGWFTVEADVLTLQPTGGTTRLEDPDDPAAGWERPTDLTAEQHQWSIEAGAAEDVLTLVDADGLAITFTH
jgi:hypothetical protein